MLAVVFLLCSCSSDGIGNEITAPEALPVQTLIDGVLKRDATLWRSAFLPEYDAAMEAQELELGSCTDYNKYVASRLEAAMAANEDNYGIDLDSIEDTAEVSGRIAISGKKNGSASDAVFVVVKCGGKWYLHPAFYNYMF